MAGKRGKKEAVDRVVDLILGEGEQVERLEDTRGLYEAPAFKRVYDELPDEPFDWEGGPLTIVTDLCERDTDLEEKYRLFSSGGDYDETRTVAGDGLVRFGGIEIVFEKVPTTGRYNLEITSAEGVRSVVFEGRLYWEFHVLAVASKGEMPEL